MTLSPLKTSATWLGLTALLSTSIAQAATNTTNATDTGSCPGIIRPYSPNAPINSTGFQSFRWFQQEQDWYFTMTFNDTRSSSLTQSMHIFQSYVSAPVDINASACIYVLPGINVEASGEWGCDGVLSSECREWLMDSVSRETSVSSDMQRGSLPSRDAMRTNCGDATANGDFYGFGTFTSAAHAHLSLYLTFFRSIDRIREHHMRHLVSAWIYNAVGLPHTSGLGLHYCPRIFRSTY